MTSHGSAAGAIRLIHFSDLHLCAPESHWSLGDWTSKRLAGWVNLSLFGRQKQFALADKVASCLHRELKARDVELCVFSGDASALGFREEIARAAELLGVADSHQSGLAVPGNHDHYTDDSVASEVFEAHFSPWLQGERVDDAIYPFARRCGPFWLVAVNSCSANRWPWDSSGSVGPEQLGRLERLFARLGPGPCVLVTHYPILRADGQPEHRWRRLRDLGELIALAREAGVCLWLHGHQHCFYQIPASQSVPWPIICAGSLGQTGRWCYGEYDIAPGLLRGRRRTYCEETEGFIDGPTFELVLPINTQVSGEP
jgi:3',5'-cyclic AMP phosphodiesterase CpdA